MCKREFGSIIDEFTYPIVEGEINYTEEVLKDR